MQCVQLAYEELRKIVQEIDMPELARYQALKQKMVKIMISLL